MVYFIYSPINWTSTAIKPYVTQGSQLSTKGDEKIGTTASLTESGTTHGPIKSFVAQRDAYNQYTPLLNYHLASVWEEFNFRKLNSLNIYRRSRLYRFYWKFISPRKKLFLMMICKSFENSCYFSTTNLNN